MPLFSSLFFLEGIDESPPIDAFQLTTLDFLKKPDPVPGETLITPAVVAELDIQHMSASGDNDDNDVSMDMD